jgi:hypothetical protein
MGPGWPTPFAEQELVTGGDPLFFGVAHNFVLDTLSAVVYLQLI